MVMMMKRIQSTFPYQIMLRSTMLSSFNHRLPQKYASSTLASDQTCSIQKLYHKDWLSPNEVVKIFNVLEPNSVLSMLNHISKRKDYKPNEPLFFVIITKLGQLKNFDAIDDMLKLIKAQKNIQISDGFFYNVIKIYGNVGGLSNRVIETLFNMPEYNCWPSTKTFNFVLNFLVCSKKFDEVHDVFLGATKLGVEIDACTLNILIKGLCKRGRLEDAFQVFDEFPKQRCKPNKQTFSTIMHCMCEVGRVDEAYGLIDRMKREGISPDAVTFNVLVSGLQKQGRIEESMELLDRMRLMGCDPNKGTYQEVLYGLLKCKRFVDAKTFVHRMRSKALIPSFMSYKLLVLGLCEEDLVEEVHWVLHSMILVGFVPRRRMWKNVVGKILSRNIFLNIDSLISEIIRD